MDETEQQNIESSTPDELTSRQELLKQIGDKLIAAREARGEKIEQAMAKLKLHKVHFQALESGKWDMLPDQIYAIGFLRQYATYLNIDIAKEIGLLNDAQYRLTKPLTFPDPPVSPSKKWAWLAGIGFVLLFIIFNIIGSNNDQYETITTVTTEESGISYGQQDAGATVEPALTPADGLNEPAESEAEPTVETASQITVVDTEAANAAATVQESESQPVIEHEYKLEAATGAVWMQVFTANAAGSAKGKLLKEVLLQEGQHTTFRETSESLWINCGNALALRIRVDGKIVADTGTLGGGKKILRDYRFDLNKVD
ncbi:MAG: XRE family transcriptional regulator [Zetaproteobacteria bacterium CG_4_9_14_3_um_filter_53_7]|nr:MAG: XRE family transcriptional regulator [Zetaproteobacteria bacterium CG_4_9_14_3_um_filter_53_7]